MCTISNYLCADGAISLPCCNSAVIFMYWHFVFLLASRWISTSPMCFFTRLGLHDLCLFRPLICDCTFMLIGIVPETHSPGMFSWFPILFPVKVSIRINPGLLNNTNIECFAHSLTDLYRQQIYIITKCPALFSKFSLYWLLMLKYIRINHIHIT